ncbi:MAG: DUF3857 domain-containing protein [Planctomycetes bacterium]|nr:DUF3857 domain-containing protein [Planctomycetota bacterium]
MIHRTRIRAALAGIFFFAIARAAEVSPPAGARAFSAVPGPDAEYRLLLDRYVLRGDGSAAHERVLRLQVNSSLAIHRRYGQTSIEYDPAFETIETLHHRTRLPSGAVVDAPDVATIDDQPPSAHRNPLWAGLRRRIYIHTALEPGAVIELGYRLSRPAGAFPWLEVAEPMAAEVPIAERIVEIEVPAGVTVRHAVSVHPDGDDAAWREPDERRSDGKVTLVWRRTKVDAVPEEPGAPPRDSFVPAVRASTCPRAGALVEELAARIARAGAAPQDAVAAARDAIAKETAWESRLDAAFEVLPDALAVTPVSPSLERWQPQPLADVWRAGVATPLELAVFQAALLGELGFVARPVLAGPPGLRIGSPPAFAGFERALVQVEDPSGAWHLYEPGGAGDGRPLEASMDALLLAPPGAGPGVPANVVRGAWERAVVVVAELSEGGELSGSLSFSATGPAVPHAALVRDPQKLAGGIAAKVVPGGRAKDVRVTALGRLAAGFTCAMAGKLPDADALGLVDVMLGATSGGVDADLPAADPAGRATPIALPGPGRERIEITLTVPGVWKIAGLPKAVSLRNAAGEVRIACDGPAEGRILLVRRIALAASEVPAAEAGAVAAIVNAWRDPGSRSLILRRAPAEE